ncbi:MAG: OmpA family protein [Ignavibacteriales bacterium]|nr:OmpA family protein [Ignavibacteriales bacterium]
MKALRLVLFSLAISFIAHAQVYKNSWAVGFGLSVPRYVGSDISGTEGNLGVHASIQTNLSEHSNFRLSTSYLMLRTIDKKFANDVVAIGYDYLYHMSPCETTNPYFGMGVSGLYYTMKGARNVKNGTFLDYQANMLFGVQWSLYDEWLGNDLKVNTELNLHVLANDKFDGVMGNIGGLFGESSDHYFTFSVGLLYYFDQGTKSKYCDLYDGILNIRLADDGKNMIVDYGKIEDIIKKYSGASSDIDYNKIEDIIKRNSASQAFIQAPGKTANGESYAGRGNWVLLGINFDAGKSSFRPEAYPILINAAQILLSNSEIRVEIEGHTDNVGSAELNKRLSQDRADAVKRFLVAKGVDASRLTAVGYGPSRPIADNKNSEGKSFNRRIEFKIIQ